MTFSKDELERLGTAGRLINDAQRALPVLATVAWDRSLADQFFASGEKQLPKPEYTKIDPVPVFEQLEAARVLIKGSSPVHDWLHRLAYTVERTARMLSCVGTQDFYPHSCALYGNAQTLIADGDHSALDLAVRLDGLLADIDESSGFFVPAEAFDAIELKARLDAALPKYFDQEAPVVNVAHNVSAKAVAGKNYIKIREDALFSEYDVTQLLQHEALIHIATGKNGAAQTLFPILGESHPGNARTQEGLAVFAEFISGALDPKRFRRLADRVIAIDMAVEGADFLELYRFFREKNTNDNPTEAFESARRVVRGGLTTGGAPFTKDTVYLSGLVEVHSYLRAAVRSRDARYMRLLFVGKLDLADLKALKMLEDMNLLVPPKFVPPWASDMRFLLSYLAYSTFLNQINLKSVNDRYTDLFS